MSARCSAAVERDRLCRHAGERRADRHGHALADAAAERMHAEMRGRELDIAIAEGAVRQRDVAHERMAALLDPRVERVGDVAVGTERGR
jgi:hypothetical protein